MELWSFKVVKLDACRSLVLSNLVSNNEVCILGALTVKKDIAS